MRSRCLEICLVTMFLWMTPAWAREDQAETAYERVMRTQTLRCGYFVWPPFFQKDVTTGANSGIYHDMIEALGRSLNLKIEWTYEYTLGTQVEVLKSGKVDALCADGPWTRSAMPYVDYTNSYMFIPGYVYVPDGNPKGLTLQKLNAPDYTFTAMDGDGSADYLQALFPKTKILSLPATADPSLLIQNVLTGKADAMLSDPITIDGQGAHNQQKLIALNLEQPLATYPFVISVPKGEQDLLNLLNQGLDLISDAGIGANIIRQFDATGKKLIAPKTRFEQ